MGFMLNDGAYWESAINHNRLLAMGYLYDVDTPSFGLASMASRTLALQNNVSLPVLIETIRVAIPEAKGSHTIELFEGGTISGGSALPQGARKNFSTRAAPFAAVLDDATIDIPGVSLGAVEGSFLQTGGYLYTSAGTQLYVTVTNNAAQASVDLQINLTAASIEL